MTTRFAHAHQECAGCIAEGNHYAAALATSRADVELWKQARGVADEHRTRLAAELAESVRALAVSQDENETTLRQHGDLCGQIEELRRALAVSQGEARHAQWLLRGLSSTCSVAPNRSKCDGGCGSSLGSGCLAADLEAIRAFLAPPAPTASPEPDRASPEVTVKENDR